MNDITEVYHKMFNQLMALAMGILKDHHLAQECVNRAILKLQDASEEVWSYHHKWLMTVCKNHALRLLENRQRRERRYPSVEPEDIDTRTDDGLNPRQALTHKELAPHVDVMVQQAMASLTTLQRTVMHQWCEGRSYADIAASCNINHGYVGYIVHQVKKLLKSHVQRQQRNNHGGVCADAVDVAHQMVQQH